MRQPLGVALRGAPVAALALTALFVAALLAATIAPGIGLAQSELPSALLVGGERSGFGLATLAGGFTPDPFVRRVVSGGNLEARHQGVADDCRGWVMAEPDFIVRLTQPGDLLRIYFVGRGDTTLLVHPPDGGWRCNDDSHGTLHPTVDLSRPRAGQYDVWVGSYRRGEAVEGRLYVTESVDRHP